MSNSSYAYAEVLDVLENMENIYVQKILEEIGEPDQTRQETLEKGIGYYE